MTDRKILILGTYPIISPQHGGQKRLRAIYDIYQQHFAQVRFSAVFYRGFYADFGKDDIPLGSVSSLKVEQSPLTGDIVCGEAMYTDPKVKAKMIKLLQEFQPDIIHVEQPFPYLGLKPLLRELGMKPKLIFGSQNIEAPMKREILESANAPEAFIDQVEKQIDELETAITVESDIVVGCTSEDLEAHRKLGAQKLVLAPNGIAKSVTNERSLAHWQKVFDTQGIARTVLFVGSAHPPNWTGFLGMVGKGIGFIPGDTRLVVAGSICDYFDREIQAAATNIEDATFWLRAISAGRLSEHSLGALIQLADVIILPIVEGGGSNLKTAEAILADKKVVATSHSLRSFEWFRDFPNVWVADKPDEFRAGIVAALQTPFKPRSKAQQQQVRQVEWQQCLADLVAQVEQL